MNGNSGESRQWRVRSLTGTGVVALALAIASIAWACTLQIGTLTVCSPVPLPTFAQNACGKKTGSGSQTGQPTASKLGSPASIIGSGFSSGKPYSILFRAPGFTSNCHDFAGSGITSLLGNKPNGTPNTVTGPNWSVGLAGDVRTPATTGNSTPTGQALICVQDYPDRVTGNQIMMAVI